MILNTLYIADKDKARANMFAYRAYIAAGNQPNKLMDKAFSAVRDSLLEEMKQEGRNA